MMTKLVRGTIRLILSMHCMFVAYAIRETKLIYGIEIAAVTLSSIYHPMLRITGCRVEMVQYTHMTVVERKR